MFLNEFILNLTEYLTGNKTGCGNIIRKHTKKIDELGDLSFPLDIKNWYHLLEKCKVENSLNIFDYKYSNEDLNSQLNVLQNESSKWCFSILKYKVVDNDVRLFLIRAPIFKLVIEKVSKHKDKYGAKRVFTEHVKTKVNEELIENWDLLDLTNLRLQILSKVLDNLLTTSDLNKSKDSQQITLINTENTNQIICGPVLNESGIKDCKITAGELYNKRKSDMRMMAQHKYGVQIKPSSPWENYFEKLGRGSVTIEMLSNKPHKAVKISLNDPSTANKGASFIFYNCARLSALFKEFEKKISNRIYPPVPDIENVDFSILIQPEEWELLYVYILQYPYVIESCVKDITKGMFNPQYIISFLSNLSSLFSVYYRRVRVLTDPREHLFGTIHARIYLLKALQQVFHNALFLLDIEPVKEM